MHKLLPAGFAFALAAPFGALADTASDIKALREEIEAIRADYEARLQALEQRLKAAEAAAATPPPAAPAVTTAAPEPVAAPTATASTPPVVASSGGGINSFNPAISLILSGLYTHTSQDPANYQIAGFPLPGDVQVGPGTQGFSLTETELAFAASVDPWLRGAANIALEANNTFSTEEAYIQTTSLGHGFSVKAGRFFSSIGYLNPQHMHTWDFVDNPLSYQAMLGTQYGDDGVELSWIAPTDQYIELAGELGRGLTYPGSDTGTNGAGMTALIAHTGGDVGDSSSWRAGVSTLSAKADNQDLLATNTAGSTVTNAFSGTTRVWVADAIWKWAPNGNATRTNFKLQSEYLRATRNGTLVYDIGNANTPGAYHDIQSGWYLQGVYQFIPHWRIGLRTEQLNPGTPDYGQNSTSLSTIDYRPHKDTVMVDYSLSEFSRFRLQFARDRAHEGFPDSQFFLQYQASLGSHGAHSF